MTGSLLRAEITEQSSLLARWADHGGYVSPSLIEAIRSHDPSVVLTIARGTSDRAADYGKYLLEILLGIPAGSTSPSTVTLFGAKPQASGVLAIAVSQSGQSPDLVAEAKALRAGGAFVIAITNETDSPLAAAANDVIDLQVGPEQAVAATKSFTAQCAALADLAAGLARFPLNRSAVAEAADAAVSAPQADEAAELLSDAFDQTGFLLCIGRGPSGPIASEGALKIMETTGLPALGYSAADFAHGPRALVRSGMPVILVVPEGEAGHSMNELAQVLKGEGAIVVSVSGSVASEVAIPVHTGQPLLDPIVQVIPLQRIALQLALVRGLDPDRPRALSKVTRTT